jgi:hypothetical protein
MIQEDDFQAFAEEIAKAKRLLPILLLLTLFVARNVSAAAPRARPRGIRTNFRSKPRAITPARIGDTPEIDEQGLTIVRDDNGAEIARITLPEDAS